MATTGSAGLDHWAASWAALPVGLFEVCLMARFEAFPAASRGELWAASRVKSLGEPQAAFRVALSAGSESSSAIPALSSIGV
jgi:hypothetical protein